MRVEAALKRILDVVGATLLLLVVSPLLVLAVVAIKVSSSGPAFFRQERVGRNGVPFTMYKLRSMRSDADPEVHQTYVKQLLAGEAAAVGGLYKLDADPRVTPVGQLLRRTSLDEVPQLVNVLRGEMSLVGPRPALPWEAELFPAWASPRYRVLPGLTGLWQVSGRNRLTMTEGLELDVRYVSHPSVLADIAILFRTFGVVLGRTTR